MAQSTDAADGTYILVGLLVILSVPFFYILFGDTGAPTQSSIRTPQHAKAEARRPTPTATARAVTLPASAPLPSPVMTTSSTKNNNWRCACEGGFLPPGMFGNAEAVLRMGSGQCYHKQT